MGAEPFFSQYGIPDADTLVFGTANQAYDTYNVSVFAGVSFTATELNGNDRITKAVFLRGDTRGSPALGCSSDGGDVYYVNMDPHSGGANRFSILKFISGVQHPVISGQSYSWPANVHHNVYFGASWDTALQTNRLRAILYLNDIHNPIMDLQVHDDSIKPGNLDPSNNGNIYAGLAVSNDSGNSINNVRMTVASPGICSLGFSHIIINDQSIDLDRDADSDGVPDSCDQCPGTIPGSSVDARGCPPNVPGDFDRDGDVDGDDLAVLTACRLGVGVPVQNPATCNKADLYPDQTVDQNDFALLQRCYSGANLPANPACTNQ
jgi:hypothetical protein